MSYHCRQHNFTWFRNIQIFQNMTVCDVFYHLSVLQTCTEFWLKSVVYRNLLNKSVHQKSTLIHLNSIFWNISNNFKMMTLIILPLITLLQKLKNNFELFCAIIKPPCSTYSASSWYIARSIIYYECKEAWKKHIQSAIRMHFHSFQSHCKLVIS